MLRIDKTNKGLVLLEPKTMRESGYWERRDVQEMICRSPEPFWKELNETLHIIGSEVRPTEFVQDRIDLLCVDPNGAAVVVEIKRDNHKLHLLQALSYVGMVAKWEPKQFLEELRKFNKTRQTLDSAKEEIEAFLEEEDIETINRNQRIVLLAEQFDYEVLITAEWLTERYYVDIRCYRLALAKNGDDDFITCTRAYPPPELTDVAIQRRRKKEVGDTEPAKWPERLSSIENTAEVSFLQNERLKTDVDQTEHYITYRVNDKRRYRIYPKKQFAFVVQTGRFENDEDYWRARLSDTDSIKTRHHGRNLRFRLRSENDFQAFRTAWDTDLRNKTILVPVGQQATEESDDDIEE